MIATLLFLLIGVDCLPQIPRLPGIDQFTTPNAEESRHDKSLEIGILILLLVVIPVILILVYFIRRYHYQPEREKLRHKSIEWCIGRPGKGQPQLCMETNSNITSIPPSHLDTKLRLQHEYPFESDCAWHIYKWQLPLDETENIKPLKV